MLITVALTALGKPVPILAAKAGGTGMSMGDPIHKYPWIDPSCTDPTPPTANTLGAQCGGVNTCGRPWSVTCGGSGLTCVRSTEWWSSCLTKELGKHVTQFAGDPGATTGSGVPIAGPWQQCDGQGMPQRYACPGPDPTAFYADGYACETQGTISICKPQGTGSSKGTDFP